MMYEEIKSITKKVTLKKIDMFFYNNVALTFAFIFKKGDDTIISLSKVQYNPYCDNEQDSMGWTLWYILRAFNTEFLSDVVDIECEITYNQFVNDSNLFLKSNTYKGFMVDLITLTTPSGVVLDFGQILHEHMLERERKYIEKCNRAKRRKRIMNGTDKEIHNQ